jgi:hypothetical protein
VDLKYVYLTKYVLTAAPIGHIILRVQHPVPQMGFGQIRRHGLPGGTEKMRRSVKSMCDLDYG